jgi:lipid-A-disaccharide synthase
MKKVMIMAGEASGDLHGGNLARELRKEDPTLALYGVGSRQMKDAGVELLADASLLSVVGLTEIIRHIGVIYGVLSKLKRFLRQERPDLLILIDFPDFNILLGKAARKLGIPILYYISPQVWAWRKGRIHTIARLVRAVVVVFPFEVPLYQKVGVDVRFVGHPLTDVVGSALSREQACAAFSLDPARRTVALLPGSRRTEVANLLPDMLGAAKLLAERYPDLQFVLPVAHTLSRDFVAGFVDGADVAVTMTDGRVYDVLRASDAAIVTSGTATLETGLMTVPMVIIYRISKITHFILSRLVTDVEHVGLVNIVSGGRLVPELIQEDATAVNMANAITTMLEDREYQARIRFGLEAMRAKLGGRGASSRAASVVMELLRGSA